MAAKRKSLIVDEELRDYLPGVPARTDAELEMELLRNGGPDDSIKVWQGQHIIVDGYRRYAICQKHDLPYAVTEKEFADREEVKYWMDVNQSARRNLTGHDLAKVVTRMAAHLEAKREAGEFSGETAAEIATALKKSTRQIYRAKEYGEALESLPTDIRQRITSGEVKAAQADVAALANLEEGDQRAVLSEYDRRRQTGHCPVCGERLVAGECPDNCGEAERPRSLGTVLHGVGNEDGAEADLSFEDDEQTVEENAPTDDGESDIMSGADTAPAAPAPAPKPVARPARSPLDNVADLQAKLGRFEKAIDEQIDGGSRFYRRARFLCKEFADLLEQMRAALSDTAEAA